MPDADEAATGHATAPEVESAAKELDPFASVSIAAATFSR
jgi:hypothetical protein